MPDRHDHERCGGACEWGNGANTTYQQSSSSSRKESCDAMLSALCCGRDIKEKDERYEGGRVKDRGDNAYGEQRGKMMIECSKGLGRESPSCLVSIRLGNPARFT